MIPRRDLSRMPVAIIQSRSIQHSPLNNNTLSHRIKIIKSYCLKTGISGKPKMMDLPIVPIPVDPYLSIQVGEDALFTRYDAIGVGDGY